MSYQLGSVDSGGRADLYADPREDEARPRFRGLVASLVVLVVIGVFAGSLWFAYQQGMKRGGVITGAADVPLIRAPDIDHVVEAASHLIAVIGDVGRKVSPGAVRFL